ncbi:MULTISPECIES: nucleotide disphospho-sugar-binding domain-containing protein [unclassified Streptomyces]|uniref:nucleotide disphospho-sugar-binding domain-containing protein n=1 Tax=unclassified Streptomyces TaxID=2593676 RepID=UPI0004BDDB4B|nr:MULTISPECIES: nucleotide disphospho-sugar-binding domain-containing protein [unclassified Streptomyces]
MRVLMTTWAAPSHFYPMVPLAWALEAAGHEVRIAGLPSVVPSILRSGLTAVQVGTEPDLAGMARKGGLVDWHRQPAWAADWPLRAAQWEPRQRELNAALARKNMRIAACMTEDLVAFARSWRPDVVVYDAVTFAGPVAAAAVGVPALAHGWGSPAVLRMELEDFCGEPLPEYLRLFESVGAAPRLEPDGWIDACPPSLRLDSPQERLGVRFVPFNGPGVMPAWLLEEPRAPRVCVTWGQTLAKLRPGQLPDLLAPTVSAVAGLGVEVVLAVTGGQRELLGELPHNVRVLEQFPLHMLLPTCEAVVHPGGGGSTLTGAVSGAAQLVISPRPEQMVAGGRVEAAGVGRHRVLGELAGMGEAGAEALVRSDVAALLEAPAYRKAAADLRAEMREQPSPAELVRTLEATYGVRGGG